MNYKLTPKTKIIVFGNKDLSDLARFYIDKEYEPFYGKHYKVEAFTLTRNDITSSSHNGLPIHLWENLVLTHPPSEYLLFAPIASNTFREQIYKGGKEKGYDFYSYISPYCTNFSTEIGENCFIFENNTIQPFTKIGNNCILWSGNHIGHHSIIEDNVFITSHCVISGHCHIKQGAYLGVNCTVRDQTTIGEWSTVGMGSLVTKNIPDNEIWIGSPAKKFEK